jgi:hypothetical protein
MFSIFPRAAIHVASRSHMLAFYCTRRKGKSRFRHDPRNRRDMRIMGPSGFAIVLPSIPAADLQA